MNNKDFENLKNNELENDKVEKDDLELDKSDESDELDFSREVGEDEFAEIPYAKTVVYEDDLSTSLSIEEIKDLNEGDIYLLIEKIDIELEQYEDILMRAQEKGFNFEEAIIEGYNVSECERLKELKKALYKNLKEIKKAKKEDGFFAKIPGWYYIISLVIFLFTLPFVSNLLTVHIAGAILPMFVNTKLSFKLIYISLFSLYMLVFILAGLIPIIKYAKKGKEIYDCKKTAKYMLVLFILNLLTISISFYYFFSSSIFD